MSLTPGIIASSLTGHLVTNNFFKIATVTGTGSSGNITFSSIPNTYKSLQIRINAIPSIANITTWLQFNGVYSGNTYAFHNLSANPNNYGITATGAGNANWMAFFEQGVMSNVYPNTAIIDIIDYANTSKYKTAKVFCGVNDNTTNANEAIELTSGLWESTAAISSMSFRVDPYGATFSTSSTFTLYGIS